MYAGLGNVDIISHSANIQAAAMRRHKCRIRALSTRQCCTGGVFLLFSVPHGTGRGLNETVHRGIWSGPVRRRGRNGESNKEVIFQLVGVWNQYWRPHLRHGVGVRARLRELGVGIRHPNGHHGCVPRSLHCGNEVLSPQTADGQPLHANRPSARRRCAQV